MSETLFYQSLIGVLCLVILVLIVDKYSDFWSGLIGDICLRLITGLYKRAPSFFKPRTWFMKAFALRKLNKDIRTQMRHAADDGFDPEVSVKFVEADKIKAVRDSGKLIVMYNPAEEAESNFINAALAYSQEVIPNNEAILEPKLKECISLTFAKRLIESHNPDLARVFGAKYLVGGTKNKLAGNPFYSQIRSLDEKQFFTRIYIKAINRYGRKYDTVAAKSKLRETARDFTARLAATANSYLIETLPLPLLGPEEPNFEPGFEYFYRANGLNINIMFIRSESNYSRQATEGYILKCYELLRKEVDIHFVVSAGPRSVRDINRLEFIKRVQFARKVAAEIRRRVDGLTQVHHATGDIIIDEQAFPIYCAVFIRTDQGR